MRNYLLIIFSSLVVFLLSGCGADESLSLKGNGENWSVEAIANSSEESSKDEEANTLLLKYKGSDPQLLDQLSYELESSQGEISGGDFGLNKDGEYLYKSNKIAETVNSKAEDIIIKITWTKEKEEQQEVVVLEEAESK